MKKLALITKSPLSSTRLNYATKPLKLTKHINACYVGDLMMFSNVDVGTRAEALLIQRHKIQEMK
ncbi:hypothetical protein [Hafnia alvei]|uniref:hypothetical protein n=1 Tax=Hafnia alvei TaxID=569 RepID=UPI000620E7AC|nr:hypothetical protein [Hafnia alvei]KKI41545.1 hypothetical protein XK86_20110 [Hafnia alvei]